MPNKTPNRKMTLGDLRGSGMYSPPNDFKVLDVTNSVVYEIGQVLSAGYVSDLIESGAFTVRIVKEKR